MLQTRSMLVSSAEPPILRTLGEFSPACEKMGADFLVLTNHGMVGIQRKTCSDLVSSLRGDRLPKELWQADQLTKLILLLEGKWWWELDEAFMAQPPWAKTFGRKQWEGVELSLQANDVWVIRTDSLEHTAARLPRIEEWLQHADHTSLRRMPRAKHSNPIVRLLCGIDGVNIKKAQTIVDHYPQPIRLTMTEVELAKLPGLGPVSAKKVMGVIPGVGEV